jgi:hypothetical protein
MTGRLQRGGRISTFRNLSQRSIFGCGRLLQARTVAQVVRSAPRRLSVRRAIRLLVGTLSHNPVLLTSSTAWAIASCKKCNIAKSAAPNRSGSFTRRAAELVQRPGRSGPRLMSQAEQLPRRPCSSKSMHPIRQFIVGWVASLRTFKVTSRSATPLRMRPVQIFRASNTRVVSRAIQ